MADLVGKGSDTTMYLMMEGTHIDPAKVKVAEMIEGIRGSGSGNRADGTKGPTTALGGIDLQIHTLVFDAQGDRDLALRVLGLEGGMTIG
jgi:hypothetical protein